MTAPCEFGCGYDDDPQHVRPGFVVVAGCPVHSDREGVAAELPAVSAVAAATPRGTVTARESRLKEIRETWTDGLMWPGLGTAQEEIKWLLAELEAAEARTARLAVGLTRAAYLAENLHGMIPLQVWRDYGADDGQGHYEGDYNAGQIAAEIKTLRALSLSVGTGKDT